MTFDVENSRAIRDVASQMIILLIDGGAGEWGRTLVLQVRNLDSDPESVASNILSMYSGMGSLNDVVLSKDGKILKKENDNLDDLRERLYQLCL
ncbi:DUF6966 domain-containing protein [Pseudomonas citronellolis]|uniref:DUF6966 domain-containing protein n=1 Tax=Pseudomonas citronellolis TaxID=53408 RepID=UPI003AAD250E